MQFKYRHQFDNHSKWQHEPISIKKTWVTKFWFDRKFDWYLAVSTVNTNPDLGHFQNGDELTPTLQF